MSIKKNNNRSKHTCVCTMKAKNNLLCLESKAGEAKQDFTSLTNDWATLMSKVVVHCLQCSGDFK